MSRRGALAAALTLVTAGTLAGAVTAGPAHAVPGLVRTVALTANNSNVFKSVTATCPAATLVVGGGAAIFGTTEASVTHLVPVAAGTGFTAAAYEDENGTAANWFLAAYAVCADPLAGWQIVTATSGSAPAPSKTVTAACPAGKRVIGTGGSGPLRGQMAFTEITPRDPGGGVTPTEVLVSAHVDETGFASGWTVTAYAICAGPVAGLTLATATTAADSLTPKSVTASCPAGTFAHGGGAALGPGGPGELFLTELIPAPNPPTGITVTGVEDQTGTPANWSATAYAICAP